jgi:hypothetical protein
VVGVHDVGAELGEHRLEGLPLRRVLDQVLEAAGVAEAVVDPGDVDAVDDGVVARVVGLARQVEAAVDAQLVTLRERPAAETRERQLDAAEPVGDEACRDEEDPHGGIRPTLLPRFSRSFDRRRVGTARVFLA